MIKSELVQIVAARNPHLYHRDVENIVNAVLDEITDALAAGNRVEGPVTHRSRVVHRICHACDLRQETNLLKIPDRNTKAIHASSAAYGVSVPEYNQPSTI